MSPTYNQTDSQTKPEETNTRDFKTLLDKASEHTIKSANKEPEPGGDILEKVSEYVPAIGKMLGQENKPAEEPVVETKPDQSIPPVRPHHDTQIEEFVRDQHRSKNIDDVME